MRLTSEKGYTATVGVSTNKLLAKLVGNTYKPDAQTTLVPPYVSKGDDGADNVTCFMDDHEVGKIPGIGFKIAQKLRAYILQRPADFDMGLVYGGTKEDVLVRDVRTCPNIGPETLERVLRGPGVPHGTGAKVWGLLNGCDDTEVGPAREVPRQISIEDSYIRLDNLDAVVKELGMLTKRLLERMHMDLLEDDEDAIQDATLAPSRATKRWLAHPKTLRLSTRPRPPQNPDGSRNRSFARISKSAPMPTFVFNLKEDIPSVTTKLLHEAFLPLFRKLHPEKNGWNLSLVNVAATNMADAASEKGGVGRDISKMFKRQDEVLKHFKVVDDPIEEQPIDDAFDESIKEDPWPARALKEDAARFGSEDVFTPSQEVNTFVADMWESDDEDMMDGDTFCCDECGAMMPTFAMGAHYRWHAQA